MDSLAPRADNLVQVSPGTHGFAEAQLVGSVIKFEPSKPPIAPLNRYLLRVTYNTQHGDYG